MESLRLWWRACGWGGGGGLLERSALGGGGTRNRRRRRNGSSRRRREKPAAEEKSPWRKISRRRRKVSRWRRKAFRWRREKIRRWRKRRSRRRSRLSDGAEGNPGGGFVGAVPTPGTMPGGMATGAYGDRNEPATPVLSFGVSKAEARAPAAARIRVSALFSRATLQSREKWPTPPQTRQTMLVISRFGCSGGNKRPCFTERSVKHRQLTKLVPLQVVLALGRLDGLVNHLLGQAERRGDFC